MDLNEKYFFLPEWIIPPDNKNIKLKNFWIEDIQNFFEIKSFTIIPVEYKGFFNAFIFILFKNNINANFIEIVIPLFLKGKENLTKLNFKELEISFKPSLKEFKFSPQAKYINIILEYEIKNFEKIFNFFVLIPFVFIRNLLLGIFGKSTKTEKISSLQKALDYIKFRLYRDSFVSFWDLRNFVNFLSDKDVQILINQLLSNNMIEETMLTAFIAGFVTGGTGEKIFRNLSKNLKQEIEYNLKKNFPDFRWINECFYLIKLAIEELIITDRLSLDSLKYIIKLKENLKKEQYRKFFQHKSFDQWIEEAYSKNIIETLRVLTPSKIIAQALSAAEEKTKEMMKKNLTKNAIIRLEEDIEYEKKNSSLDEKLSAQIEIIENLKKIYYEKQAQNITEFEDIISSLDSEDLNLLIEECGILEFAQATINTSKKFKKNIYSKISGTMKNLLSDIYSGKVRFKAAFGEQTINRLRQQILQTYLFLKGEGKIEVN